MKRASHRPLLESLPLGSLVLAASLVAAQAQEGAPSRVITAPAARPPATAPAPVTPRPRPSIRRPGQDTPGVSRPAAPLSTAQEKPLVELSEVMGALTFLSQLCAPGTEPNPWRRRMETLLEAEGEASGTHDRMAGAYNTGFADYATTYRQCTPAALAAQQALVREAARLARDLERRFGS
jgi:uncharacterized protein (TIGR02301 family)